MIDPDLAPALSSLLLSPTTPVMRSSSLSPITESATWSRKMVLGSEREGHVVSSLERSGAGASGARQWGRDRDAAALERDRDGDRHVVLPRRGDHLRADMSRRMMTPRS